MKPVYRIFFFLAVMASAVSLVSCAPDNTSSSDPNDARNVFVGVWQFTESGMLKNGNNISQSYIVSIILDPDNSNQVLLNNFGNPGSSDKNVVGIVTSNQIVVSAQSLNNGWLVEGSGKSTGTNKMTWSYSITAGGDKIYYSASATKQ